MSLSATDPSGFPRATGKTPPPAPSAAYAKRARELQAEERLNAARYRPPALRGLTTGSTPSNDQTPIISTPIDGSALPPTNYPAGFRRARAGTLPTNVQLAAQHFAAAASPLQSLTGSTESFSDTYSQTQLQPSLAVNSASTLSNAIRPSLRHSASIASSAASSAATERNSRLRSGSLTLPSSGLNTPFGSSLFGTNWLSGSNRSGFSTLDELRSAGSMDSGGGDDFDVHTLDYLGLDEAQRPQPASISELRNQAQAAIANNLANPPRHRASTVSNPYRMRSGTVHSSLLSTPNAEEEEEDLLDNYDTNPFDRRQLDSYENTYGHNDSYFHKSSQHLGVSNGFGVRPRAISVGILDNPLHASQGLHSEQNMYSSDLFGGSLNKYASGRGTISPSITLTTAESTSRTNPYLLTPTQGRTVSPKSETATQVQTPTRSLWIGNLDSSVTSEQLIHHFAPYGAIESLRLLPEKECGFVNFVDLADAIRAKDDVLNRLGGQIGMPNGQAVRIGFGKADSAPVAPAKGNNTNSTVTAQPNSTTKSSAAGANNSMNGMESQLQSTPTRALWIGSIPSTTTPGTILSVFSPYGPIESARVLTHKNCGFINFERLDDAVRARKALNGRDVLGSDVGAIRIGFAKVPVKNGSDGNNDQEDGSSMIQGVGDLSVGATINALRNVKGASAIPTDQQVLSGAVENYRSNLLLSMISSGNHNNVLMSDGIGKQAGVWSPTITEQQMVVKELSEGSPDAETEILAHAEFRPPAMYYTNIPSISERTNNRRWDASKLRELRKRLDSGSFTTEEVDEVAADFIDGEIVDLASDWLGNTVVQKLFEKCSLLPRFAMLERIAPHLAMIGIHKNGTWAAQKVIECVKTPEEVALIAQHLRPYTPPLLLDQFGNYVIQCCLRFGPPADDFIFDAMVDRLWEIAQGRFGARSMRACLESTFVTVSQQRRIATAIILNSIPLATNPNGALLLTWLLDTSGFPARYRLLAPRFTPHLSHLCTHKLASLTVLRIINQKVEPSASTQLVHTLFFSPGDHVLTDVLGDQVNGVAVVHKILTSAFIDPLERPSYLESTKRVLIELKASTNQAYRRLIEEVGLPVPNFTSTYPDNVTQPTKSNKLASPQSAFNMSGFSSGYGSNNEQNLSSMMAALQMGGQNVMGQQLNPPVLQIDPMYVQNGNRGRTTGANANASLSPSSDPFNPFSVGSSGTNSPRLGTRRSGGAHAPSMSSTQSTSVPYGAQSPSLAQAGNLLGLGQSAYGMPPQSMSPQLYQAYMYQMYQQQNHANVGAFHT